MFDSLSHKLTDIFANLRKKALITENDVNDAMRQMRIALLNADVSLPVVKTFIEEVRAQAIGHEVLKSIAPGHMIIKIVQDHLVALLQGDSQLNLACRPPACLLMVGLQGSGKTTTTGKLAKYLKEKHQKRVLLVSLDVYRPAAQKQLEILALQQTIDALPIVEGEKPLEIVKRAHRIAQDYDVVIYDTAGRLQCDDDLMTEVANLQHMINPIETLLVVDSMTGQDAVSIAKGFQERVTLTGIILTRIDGDSRGGAALSMRAITQCPIKFLGVGEKSENLEVFDANRMADRILDKGDIVSLVEKAQLLQDSEETDAAMQRFEKGLFDLNDMAVHLESMLKMGGFSSLIDMLPGMQSIKNAVSQIKNPDKEVKRHIGIIHAMTPKERRNVKILNASRRRRIAKGAGVLVSDVNKLIKNYEQMSVMMKQARKGGGMFKKMMKGFPR